MTDNCVDTFDGFGTSSESGLSHRWVTRDQNYKNDFAISQAPLNYGEILIRDLRCSATFLSGHICPSCTNKTRTFHLDGANFRVQTHFAAKLAITL